MMKKPGLFANLYAKQKRIAAGSCGDPSPGKFSFYPIMTPPNTKTIRDLMLTIELIRSHFEQEENISESAQFILDIATDRNAACAEYIPDYLQPSFLDDVTKILAS